jgi:hypothetical protein
MESYVFYPIAIGVGALWLIFASRREDPRAWLKCIAFGFTVVGLTFGLLLIEGLSLQESIRVLTFLSGEPLGLRRLAAIGYLLIIAGFILMVRSFMDRKSSQPEQ